MIGSPEPGTAGVVPESGFWRVASGAENVTFLAASDQQKDCHLWQQMHRDFILYRSAGAGQAQMRAGVFEQAKVA